MEIGPFENVFCSEHVDFQTIHVSLPDATRQTMMQKCPYDNSFESARWLKRRVSKVVLISEIYPTRHTKWAQKTLELQPL